MAAVTVMSIPEIAAKVVAFVAKAVLVVPAAARCDPLVQQAYEFSLLFSDLPELLSGDSFQSNAEWNPGDFSDHVHPCHFCRVHDSQP